MASLLDHSGSSPFSKNDNTDPDKEKNVNKFRFIYLSGGAAERDQTKPLWFKQDYRRIRVRQFTFFFNSLFPIPSLFFSAYGFHHTSAGKATPLFNVY